MRRGYVVPMRCMVIYGVPGGALNLNSTNYPDHGHHGDRPLSGKNPHGRAENRTRDLMISSQKCRALGREAGHIFVTYLYMLFESALSVIRMNNAGFDVLTAVSSVM
jgi:hypothetical protein